MPRKPAIVLAWVSLAMAATVAALGIVANVRTDTVGWAGWRDKAAGAWHGWGVHSRRGRLVVYYCSSSATVFDDPTSIGMAAPSAAARPHAFHHVTGDRPPPDRWFRFAHVAMPWIDGYFVAFPHAAAAAVLAALPAWAGVRRLRARRQGRAAPPAAFPVVAKA